MTYEEAEKWEFNPFDLTKVWPHSEFPLIPVGRMTLDRNPKNYFAEVWFVYECSKQYFTVSMLQQLLAYIDVLYYISILPSLLLGDGGKDCT